MTNTNVVFTNGTEIVTIGVIKFEDILNKKYPSKGKMTSPQGSSNYKDGPKDTMVVDLLQIERIFIITGELVHTLGDNDTTATPVGKKADLITIFETGGMVTMTDTDNATHSVNLDGKLSFIKVINDGADPAIGEAGWDIMMTVIKGINYTEG